VGKFVPKTGPYNFFPIIFTTEILNNCLVFDLNSRTFFYGDSWSASLKTFTIREGAPRNPNNMSVTLKDFLIGRRLDPNVTGFAVMQNVNTGGYVVYYVNFGDVAINPLFSEIPVPEGCKMPFAKVKSAPSDGQFIYFAEGNELWLYKNATGLTAEQRESVLLTLPKDETITYMAPVHGSYDNFAILTNNATGWKLYIYRIVATANPELHPDPVVYSGEGFARYVMYRVA
jgi:hypothetical protein